MSKRYFIFLCSNQTLPEVIIRKLLGHRYNNYKQLTELISKDDIFLLYNYDSKVIVDILKATGEVGIDRPLEPSAFNGKFPIQAKFNESVIPNEFKKRPLPKAEILSILRFSGEFPQFVLTTNEFNLIIKKWSDYTRTKPPKFDEYNQYGYIFLCDNTTAGECLDKKIFGASDTKWQDYIRKIQIGSPCFLWNYQSNELYGIFQAKSNPYYDREKRNFGGRYPAQIEVDLLEKTSSPIKKENLRSIIDFNNFPPIRISSEITQKIINEFNKNTTYVDNSRNYRANDGHIVKSQGELIIDNFLFHNKLIHAYGIRVPISGTNMFTDFYLPEGDVYIEFWGGLSSKEQEEKKKNWYKSNGKKLISIYPKDIELGIDDKLKKELLDFGYIF